MTQPQNVDKNRKTNAQEISEQADHAGRLRADDKDTNDDNDRPMTQGDKLNHARNKANEAKDETLGIP